MKFLVALVLSCAVFMQPALGQVSESTEEWPAWQKVAVGVLGSTSVLSTVALIGAANSDGNGSNTESGESNSDGSSESNANANERKSQGYVEELTDELLVFVNAAGKLSQLGNGGKETIEMLADEYPVLMNYYLELIADHPNVIEEIDKTIDGDTLVERLNTVMMVHLFSE